ncbi:hypothetical protein D3C87_2079780 [compost metagenome]
MRMLVHLKLSWYRMWFLLQSQILPTPENFRQLWRLRQRQLLSQLLSCFLRRNSFLHHSFYLL